MLEENFARVYDKLHFEFYRSVFSRVKEREGSLTAMEAFSLEIINHLGQPSIGQFADFLGISQSNATYKVNSLMRKGYIKRENSEEDRREYRLVLSEKYYGYMGLLDEYTETVMKRVRERFSERELQRMDEILGIIADELMPETSV